MLFPRPTVTAADIDHRKPLTEIIVLVESCFYFNIPLSSIFSHLYRSVHLLPLLDFRSLQLLKFWCLTRSLCVHVDLNTEHIPAEPACSLFWQFWYDMSWHLLYSWQVWHFLRAKKRHSWNPASYYWLSAILSVLFSLVMQNQIACLQNLINCSTSHICNGLTWLQ